MKNFFPISFLALLLGLLAMPEAMAQQAASGNGIAVKGTVVDAKANQPLPGVTVIIKGTSTGTVTDVDGKFSLTVPSASSALIFSFVGFNSETVTVGNNTSFNIALTEDVDQLKEVVVTAFGLEKEKKALPYAVSEVGGEEVSTVKQTNVVNSLAGRVAGVVITQSTAGPGSGSRVIIRGNNSLTGNNQPLYVVDGVPIDNSGFGSAAGDGTGEFARSDYGTGVSDINPDDIESMSVLKGPNAAALYGSRAANGVIMITTKKGSRNKGLGITYSSNFTWENPLLLPDYQNQYGQGSEGKTYTDLGDLKQAGGSWGAQMDGSSQLYYNGENRPFVAQPNNVKDFFQTGSNYINTIALDGGTENASLRFSYTNTNSDGILPNSELNRHNFNLRGFAKLTENFTVDSRVTYFTQEARNRPTQGTEGIMAYLYNIPRNLNILDLQDYQNEADFRWISYSASAGNPYWILNNDINEDSRNRISGFVKANYVFTPWLSAFARVGTDRVSQKIETVNKYGHWFYGSGRFDYREVEASETNADFMLMFNKNITENINLSINAGGNHRYQTFEAMSIFGENFKLPSKWNVENANKTLPSYTPLQEKKVNSVYGSAQFAYNNILFVDFSARNDWSSALERANRSFFYPSVGVSFLLNEVLPASGQLMDLWKIRASWAQVGNDTDPYQTRNVFLIRNNGYLGRTTLFRQSVRLSEDLRPEQISTYEVGTELRLLKNRLFADLTYYKITSEDLIMDVDVPEATGYTKFRTNVGQMTNKGIEFMIGGRPVVGADFSWEISLNAARNKNTLDELFGELKNVPFTVTNGGTVTVQASVGGGFGDIMGTTYLRDPQGRIVVNDAGIPQLSSEKVLLGNYQPDWTGGLSNTVMYKDLSLRFLIDGRFGGQLFSGTDAGMDAAGVSAKTLQYREEGVVVPGVVNLGSSESPIYEPNTIRITAEQYWQSHAAVASNYVFDQTNVRLREVSLTYNLPGSLMDKTPFRGGNIGLIGRNLFFLYKKIDNFDPESSFSTSNYGQGVLFYNLPTTRQYGINLNLRF